MYIDDLSVGEVVDLDIAVSTFSQKAEQKLVHARKCEEVFEIITKNACSIGMKINAEKTQLLCISDSNYSNTTSYLYTGKEERITSSNEMKILGFVFGERPNADLHVAYTIKKFNRAVWSLNHIKRAGVANNILVQVYCSMLRPIVEFCSVVYHNMLTSEQNLNLERLQKMALKIIFGFNITYELLLEKAGVKTLEERRKDAFKKFTLSLQKNNKYCEWFPKSETRNLRHTKPYQELFARTARLYKSPLFCMRRLLNEEFEDDDDAEETH